MSSEKPLASALQALAEGRDADAIALLEGAGDLPMAVALLGHLNSSAPVGAYDQAHAFEAFIRGGGNVALYDALSAFLAAAYDRLRPTTLLDIGVGDGMALIPALERARHAPTAIDVVEPNATLLESLTRRLEVRSADPRGLEAFAADLSDRPHWDIVQSTFAMQSMSPAVRTRALRQLAAQVRTLIIVEFDVPVFEPHSHALYRSLASRYEQAARECGADAALVAAGFLAPMVLGQLRAEAPSNQEQPAAAWVDELRSCGFTDIVVDHIHDYSWAPAVGITARP